MISAPAAQRHDVRATSAMQSSITTGVASRQCSPDRVVSPAGGGAWIALAGVGALLVVGHAAQGESKTAVYPPVAETLPDEVGSSSLWQGVTAALPGKERYFAVQGAWLDHPHHVLAAVVARQPVELEEYTNGALAIIEVDKGNCRQLLDLFDSKRDYRKPECLSLPMHTAWKGPWRGFPRYSHARFYSVDVDGDGISDLVVTLWYSGGSYSPAETFVLRKTGEQYRIVLSKRGAESGQIKFDRVADLDGDGKPEILIWDEIWGPGSHAEARDWVDIFHWSGDRMVRVNHQFPLLYAPVKAGMQEVCKWHPGETPEFYYFLGLVAEYEGKVSEARSYYELSLSADRSVIPEERPTYGMVRAAYRGAAKQRLSTLGRGPSPNPASQPTPREGAAER